MVVRIELVLLLAVCIKSARNNPIAEVNLSMLRNNKGELGVKK